MLNILKNIFFKKKIIKGDENFTFLGLFVVEI